MATQPSQATPPTPAAQKPPLAQSVAAPLAFPPHSEHCPRCHTWLVRVSESYCPSCGLVLPMQLSQSKPV